MDSTRRDAGADGELQARYVLAHLRALDTQELADYQTHMIAALRQADSWDLRGVCNLVNGGGSDDGYWYFRGWLVGQGRVLYEQVVGNPDDLVDYVIEINLENEDLIGAANEVHHSRTGSYELTKPVGIDDGPRGTRWSADELPIRLPKTFSKYGRPIQYLARAVATMLLWLLRSATRGLRRSP